MATVYTPVPAAFASGSSFSAGCSERNRLHSGRKEKKGGNGKGEEMIECGRKVVTLL